MQTKTCTCKTHIGERDLPITSFHKCGRTEDGLSWRCKQCASDAHRRDRERIKMDPDRKQLFLEDRAKWRERKGKVGQLFEGARGRAKKFGLEFTISREDIVIPDVCPILGIPIIAGKGRQKDAPPNQRRLVGATDNSPSVDRIDNSKGYTKDNIIVISWRANYLKNTATLDELIKLGEFAKRYYR